LLAAAQAVEHYEISRYGTLKTWAGKLGLQDAVKLLDETLAEEEDRRDVNQDRGIGRQRRGGVTCA
jgi:ferritin-like metal-binding protein YciE